MLIHARHLLLGASLPFYAYSGPTNKSVGALMGYFVLC